MKSIKLGRVLIGGFVILLGTSLLLEQFNIPLFNNLVSLFWPLVLLCIGIYFLITVPRRILLGIFLLLAGLTLVLSQLFNLNISIWNFWPLVLIIVGFNVIFGYRFDIFKKSDSLNDDELNINTIFWGSDRKVVSDSFKGGSLLVVFGGSKLDLRGVKFQKEMATLNVITAFGGTEIFVDENTKVVNKGSGIFGAFEEKTHPGTSSIQTLVLTGFAAFGGVGVK